MPACPVLSCSRSLRTQFRHGLSNRTSDGQISILAARQGANLSLMVKDNGCGLPADSAYRRKGLGLATTRGRLERLYGNNQSLILRNVKSGGVEVRILFPLFLTPALVRQASTVPTGAPAE